MSKELTLEDYQDKMNKLQRQQMQIVVDADKLAKEIQETSEKFYELSPEYTKITCITCGGTGIVDNQETGKKERCHNDMIPMLSCKGKEYIWMKKFSEVVK